MDLENKVYGYCKRALTSLVLAAGIFTQASVLSGSDSLFYELSKAEYSGKKGAFHSLVDNEHSVHAGFFEYSNFIKSGIDGKYDNHNMFYSDSIDKLLEPVHKIYGHLTVEITKFSYDSAGKATKNVYEKVMTSTGTGTIVENTGRDLKILTCAHVASPPTFQDEYDLERRPVTTFKVKDIKYVLEQCDVFMPEFARLMTGVSRVSLGPELRVLGKDEKNDLALMQTKGAVKGIEDYKVLNNLGNSNEISEGDFLYIVGYPRNITKQVIQGHVSAKSNPYSKHDDFMFYADASVNEGNSGGPVYALRDGKPEFVGVVHSKWPEGIGGIIRSSRVTEFLKRLRLERINDKISSENIGAGNNE